MANQIQFELASPERMVVGMPVFMASVPGSEGMFGVLAGHAPVATKLGAGLVKLFEKDMENVSREFFVSGGFCQVTADRCAVMADEIIRKEDLKPDMIEAEIKELLVQADAAHTEEERESLADRIEIARAKLYAAG